MKRFKNILMITEMEKRNDAVLQRAIALSKHNKAQITVAEVIQEMPEDIRKLTAEKHSMDIQDLVVQERLTKLKYFIAPFKEETFQMTIKILVGNPFLKIIQEVQWNNHDLVMIGVKRKEGFKELLFGSNTIHLLRKCPCPVWAIKQTQFERFSRILAAVDPVPSEKEKDELNNKIMEMAASLA